MDTLRTPAALASLIAANLAPLVGILLLGWSPLSILVLYFVDTIFGLVVVVLLVMMRRRVGLEHVGRTLGVVARVAIAGAIAAGLSYAAWYGVDMVLGDGVVAQLLSLGAGFAVALLVYVGLARALGLRELEALLLLRSRRDDPPEQR